MSAILATVLGGVLDKVIDKVTNQIPVSQTEKDNLKVQAEKELATHAGSIAEATAQVSSDAKDVWLADLVNGSFLTISWRPIAALLSLTIIVWDGIMVNLINGVLAAFSVPGLVPTPAHTVEVAMWVLLALVGVRGAEKISVIRAKVK